MTKRKPDPLNVIQKLMQERYLGSKVIFWAGSVAQNKGTSSSDLDLVVVYDHLPNAYRETFVYETWPIDAFIHDPKTLLYFYNHLDIPSFMLALPTMVATGIQIPENTPFGKQLQSDALQVLNHFPTLNTKNLENRRFHITDMLDDLKSSKNLHEKMAIRFALYEKLAEFYLLAHKHWIGTGKQLVRALEQADVEISQEFHEVFSDLGDIKKISDFVEKVLEPYGGLLWDGFKLDAPCEWKSFE